MNAKQKLVQAFVAAAEKSGNEDAMVVARGAQLALIEGRLDVRRTSYAFTALVGLLTIAAGED